ncbi:MAG TPA: Asp-tRNA(Asn)/Glu-tRNA(Gln) amidotransferase subunit GatC [Nitrososphaeraceae archaeon]|jgi:aspartyl-tRNA(Asn)/glutamyl-tRNA(Gln) amidotransferase subunit C|nr:Asp-tRNA(Asn)/Glu-tRNA(Gln) amidotransferase subunit GatC [Nitrososphaeraceae archaeon]
MVSKDDIRHLGWLARLDLSDEELSKYESQVDRIIQHFDVLDSLTLDVLEPTYLTKSVRNLRMDEPKDYNKNVLPRTRKQKDGYLKGPKGDVK